MDGLILFLLVSNAWFLFRLVRMKEERDDYKTKASHWLQRYNEK
jgi:hypothetical protein